MKSPFRLSSLAVLLVIAGPPGAGAPPVPAQESRVGLRQIVVGSEAEGLEIRERVLDGESFETLARTLSVDPSRAQGGYLGTVALEDMRSEFQTALRGLGPGDLSLPAPVDGRYFLFQIMTEAETRWMALDESGFRAAQQGRRAEAVAVFEEAIVEAEALAPEYLIRSLNNLANVYRTGPEAAKAEGLYRRALGILEEIRAPGHPDVAEGLNNLGLVLLAEKRYDEAESAFRRALAIREAAFGADAPEAATVLANLGDVHRGRAEYLEAGRLYARSVEILERTAGAGHPVTIGVLESLLDVSATLVPELLENFATLVDTAYFRDSVFEEQALSFADLLAVTPLDETSYVAMKDALLESDLADLAEAVLRRAAGRFPQSRLIRYHTAELLAEAGRSREALAAFVEASAMAGPPDLDAAAETRQVAFIFQRIGDMHTDLFEFDEARAAYVKALEIDPATPGGRVALGRMYLASNRLEEALGAYEDALSMGPSDDPALRGDDHALQMALSEVYLALGRFPEAVTAADAALALDPADRQARYLRGRALTQMGQRERGQEELLEFARLEQAAQEDERRYREIRAIQTEAMSAFREGDFDEAIRIFERGIRLYPDSGDLYLSLGIAWHKTGEHRAAVETLRTLVEGGISDHFLVHQALADAYEALGDTAASARHRAIYLERSGRSVAEAVDPR